MWTANEHFIKAVVVGGAGLALLAGTVAVGRSLSPYCAGTAPIEKVSIEAAQGVFLPSEIRVKAGACVELWIRATSGTAHNAVIEGTEITSEGAPLFDHDRRRYGRAMARQNPELSPVKLEEGWFAKGDQVLLRFQAMRVGTYRLRCRVAEQLHKADLGGTAHARPMEAVIIVSK